MSFPLKNRTPLDPDLRALIEKMTFPVPHVIWVPLGTPCVRCGGAMERSQTPIPHPYRGLVRCTHCTYRNSVLQFLAEALFPIQPMPEGAVPIYMSEPDKDPNDRGGEP